MGLDIDIARCKTFFVRGGKYPGPRSPSERVGMGGRIQWLTFSPGAKFDHSIAPHQPHPIHPRMQDNRAFPAQAVAYDNVPFLRLSLSLSGKRWSDRSPFWSCYS